MLWRTDADRLNGGERNEVGCAHVDKVRERVHIEPVDSDAEVDAITVTSLQHPERCQGADLVAGMGNDVVQRPDRDQNLRLHLNGHPAEPGDPPGEPHDARRR